MNKKFLTAFSMMFLVIALLVGCSSSSNTTANDEQSETSSNEEASNEEEEILELSMGVSPWIGYGPWFIAKEKGIFEKYGLNVDIIPFEQDSDRDAAFASDNIQIMNAATHTVLRMSSNFEIDVKAIIFMDQAEEADAILATSEIENVEQLKGKKVAFEEGATSDLLLQQALSEVGMTLEDVETVFMPAHNAGLSLVPGTVDAAVTYQPFINEVISKGESRGIHVIYSGKDSPGLISDIVVLKADFLAEHPELKEKLQQVWDEAMAFWQENEDEGNEIVASNTGTTTDDLPPILEGLKFFTIEEQVEKFASGEIMEAAENIQKVMLNSNDLREEIDLEEMFDLE